MNKLTDVHDTKPKETDDSWWRWYLMVLVALVAQIVFYSWFTHYYQ